MAPSSTPCSSVNQPMTSSDSPKAPPLDVALPVLEDDEQRHERGRHPEEGDDAVDEEVRAVLHGEQARGLEPHAEQAQVAAQHPGHPPKAAKRLRPCFHEHREPEQHPHPRPLGREQPQRLARAVHVRHQLHGQADLVAEGQPVQGPAQGRGKERHGVEVAGAHEEEREPHVHQPVAALHEEAHRADEHVGQEGDEPAARERQEEAGPAPGRLGHGGRTHLEHGEEDHGHHDEAAHGKGAQVLRRVAPQGRDGTQAGAWPACPGAPRS